MYSLGTPDASSSEVPFETNSEVAISIFDGTIEQSEEYDGDAEDG